MVQNTIFILTIGYRGLQQLPMTQAESHMAHPTKAASTRSFYTMETMTTALNTSRRQNWNRLDNYQTYWMWWMKTHIKRTMKAMMKATPTMKTTPTMKATHQMKAKIKEDPSYPHTSGRMGAMAINSTHRHR